MKRIKNLLMYFFVNERYLKLDRESLFFYYNYGFLIELRVDFVVLF